MKVKITGSVIWNGKDLFAGNVYDLDEDIANALLMKNKAVKYKEEVEAKEPTEAPKSKKGK